MANKKVHEPVFDDDNPEWTEADFARARPASEFFSEEELKALDQVRARRGRPNTENPKQSVSIRLSPDVLEAFKATGKGWHTRIDETLKAAISRDASGRFVVRKSVSSTTVVGGSKRGG